jgi:guanosine-3',5'-bis(diphosphate) 3'-pyrophosphohydrolase
LAKALPNWWKGSKLDKLKFRDKKEAQAENFRKMIMAMVQDIRVILIKLADRTHNMRTLGSLRPDKRRRIARETLEIYSPLAHRLGIHHIKTELEELGFEALYPNRYRVIKEVVKAARGNRKEMIQKILSEIEGRLQEAGIPCRVSGREKHLYSIYCKMVLKEQRFHSIMDIYAFRVIVHDADTCYRVLGQMHSLYKPRPGRVKDYIAIPKANGYQSLHTSMIGPHGVPVEVQIRTEDMDQMAEMGLRRTGLIKSTAAKAAPPRKSAPSAGCRACWSCSRAPAARLNLSRALNPICSRMRFTFSPRKGALSNCPLAQRRWTSPTRCIPISAMPASARASTASLIRCRSRSPAARRWKLLPRRAHVRTPPG